MSSELWYFFLGIWVWQGVITIACFLTDDDEMIVFYMSMGLWVLPLSILLKPIKLASEFKQRGGYVWSLFRAPNGDIVRVWPQKKYRYQKTKHVLIYDLGDVGYKFITQDDAKELIKDFGKNPWKNEDFRGRVNVQYTPWVVAKKFPKLVVTKDMLQQVVAARKIWEESEGDNNW